MDSSPLLFRVGLLACALLCSQVSAHAQADTEPDEWTPAERAEMRAYRKAHKAEFEADSIREAEYMREELKGRYILSDSTVYTASAVDQPASIVGGGGEQGVLKAIQRAFRYPALALKKQREGIAIVSFVIDENGAITQAKIIKGLGYGIDEEIVRATNSLPKFIPARCSGQAVRFGYTLAIALKIQ